jgi:uncharacterized protein YndB with AHSA1/START domain
MAVVRQAIGVSVDAVYAALVTPQTYPHWLVGCQDIRSVDADWPTPGSRFHHRVGLGGPVTVADSTEVLAQVDDHLLSLEVRARPFGRGRATFTIRPGTGTDSSVVELDEVPIGFLAPTKPLADPFINRRNVRSLRALAAHLERGESQAEPSS